MKLYTRLLLDKSSTCYEIDFEYIMALLRFKNALESSSSLKILFATLHRNISFSKRK